MVLGQKSQSQLEKEKKENLIKLKEAQKILSETEGQKKVSLGQLSAIKEQIKIRQTLITSLKGEINTLDEDIGDISIVVNALTEDLADLKKEYAAMIYAASKYSKSKETLTFLFSAKSFNEFYRKMKYLDQYAESRKQQVDQVEKVKKELELKKNEVIYKKSKQDILLKDQLVENKKLLKVKAKQSQVINKLSSKEKQLKKELADRKRAISKLDNLIASAIKKATKIDAGVSNINDISEVTRLFEKGRKNLNWPVKTGFVSSKFGRQPHPVIKGIEKENLGVDIQTNKGSHVKPVFNGKVIAVSFVPGMNNAVLIQHGKYYTLYAKLVNVRVKRGDVVSKDDILGDVFTSSDGITELQFQVWKTTQKLDPEQWLAAK